MQGSTTHKKGALQHIKIIYGRIKGPVFAKHTQFLRYLLFTDTKTQPWYVFQINGTRAAYLWIPCNSDW